MKRSIDITTRKQLDIYMNPQRQRLLKCMDLKMDPMTPKQISDILKISPSSVTYHLKKLEELGIVELHHTEQIHGICAKFYHKIPVSINLGAGQQGDLKAEKEALCDYMINDIYTGFKKYMNETGAKKQETPNENGSVNPEEPIEKEKLPLGDMKNEILYLTETEAAEVRKKIEKFIEKHSTPKKGSAPWEVAVIAYPRKEVE